MPRFRVLISAPYLLPVIDGYAERFAAEDAEYVKADVNERLEEADLLSVIAGFDGVIAGDDRFTRRVFEAAANLKVLVKWGTGIDSFDQDAARDHGVTICNTPDAFTEPVADSVLGYMLAFARNVPFMDAHMKAGVWRKIPGRAMNESTLGIIGLGATGSAVARRARAFGATLLATDIRAVQSGHAKALDVEMTTLPDLLARSDFVSVNCDLNPTSHHLIDEAALRAMKPGAVLINCARGPVVDEPALCRALEAGTIAGAGLDVFEDEPLPADSPLRACDRVLMAPHNSNSSPKAWERVHENSLASLFRELGRHR